jgi:hypothetical protein
MAEDAVRRNPVSAPIACQVFATFTLFYPVTRNFLILSGLMTRFLVIYPNLFNSLKGTARFFPKLRGSGWTVVNIRVKYSITAISLGALGETRHAGRQLS